MKIETIYTDISKREKSMKENPELAIEDLERLKGASLDEFGDHVAINVAIEALTVFSNVKAMREEIEAMSGDIETISDALAIIDKYKAESEGTE